MKSGIYQIINLRNGKAYKLNEIQVRVIKYLLGFKTLTLKEIGNIFNVKLSTINNIKRNKTWIGI